jgi:hypothetical protein
MKGLSEGRVSPPWQMRLWTGGGRMICFAGEGCGYLKLLSNFRFFVWANERDHCLSGQADMPAGHVVHKFAVG